jgi:hypothetical protein
MNMKYRANLMVGFIGLALLAAPITASAKDNDRGDNGRGNSHQVQSESHASAPRSYSAPQRSNDHVRNAAPENTSRRAAPENMTRSESRPQQNTRDWAPAPSNLKPADRDNHREARDNHDNDHRGDRDQYRDNDGRYYGNRDYDDHYAEGGPYVMPYGYAGGACAWARHLRTVYYQDRATGHPAAAADLLPQLRNAERRCGGVPYGYNDYDYPY